MPMVPTFWADDPSDDNDWNSWQDDQTYHLPMNTHAKKPNWASPTLQSRSPAQQMLLYIAQQNQSSTTTTTVWNPTSTISAITKYYSPSFVNKTYANNVCNSVSDGDYDQIDRDASSKILTLYEGTEKTIVLPDKSRIEIKADGSYEVVDKDAKITYRASRIKDFNPFLNASDKLEEFIAHCDRVGVRQSEVLRLPLELFIAWLVISAARQDDIPAPDLPLDVNLKRRAIPRCTGCGRFLSHPLRQRSLEYCAPRCYGLHHARALAAPPPPSALVPIAKAA